MVSKTEAQTFNADWEKAIAFAQQHGIGSKDLLPIYQQDAQRMANYGTPMSIAERNRALLAAKNPNNVTPVPSDKPNPSSFLGNFRSNLANIFTGLAPNHLIPNIVHSAVNAVVHPQSWLHPIEEVGQGVATGNIGEVRTGIEAAGSANSILNWVPGVYDLAQLSKGGVDALLTQPVTAFLDVAPFAPAGRVLSLATNEMRMGAMASKLGMTTEALQKASIPKMGMAWAMMRPLTKIVNEGDATTTVNAFPGAGLLTRKMMRDENDNPLTIKGMLSDWSRKSNAVSKVVTALGAGSLEANILGTDAVAWSLIPAQRAFADLSPELAQQANDLLNSNVVYYQVTHDGDLDPAVVDAYKKGMAVKGIVEDQTLASGDIAFVRGPKNAVEVYVAGERPSPVVESSRAMHSAILDTVKMLGPTNELRKQMDASGRAIDQSLTGLEQSRTAALQTPIKGRTEPVYTDIKGAKPKGPIRLSYERQKNLLTGDTGLVGQLTHELSHFDEEGKARNPDYETALAMTKASISSLEHEGIGRVPFQTAPQLTDLYANLKGLKSQLEDRVKMEKRFEDHLLKRRGDKGTLAEQLKKLAEAQAKFHADWWANASDAWRSVGLDAAVDRGIELLRSAEKIGAATETMKSLGWGEKQREKVLSDDKLLMEFAWHNSRYIGSNPAGVSILTEEEKDAIYQSFENNVRTLREMGETPMWMPVVTSRDLQGYRAGTYSVGTNPAIRTLSTAKPRAMRDLFQPERYDAMAALHLSTQEIVRRNNAIEVVTRHIAPHSRTDEEMAVWAQRAFPDEYGGRPTDLFSHSDLAQTHLDRLGMVEWDPIGKVGFTLPRWGRNKVYLPKSLAKAYDSMISHQGFPMDGVYDKATNVFRTAILDLSPRFTAHKVFGTGLMLIMRSGPGIANPANWAKAWDAMKDPTSLPAAMRQTSAERGVEGVTHVSVRLERTRDSALGVVAHQSGTQLAHMHAQEQLAKEGKDWRTAGPVAWASALAKVNRRFTDRVSLFYRALAMFDHAAKAGKEEFYTDPVTGQRVAMTPERAQEEGVQAALKGLGDLHAVSPLERRTFMRIMPFYGWTKHVLQYVMTYPVDHPYRAQFLAVQASFDAEPKALEDRLLFMFFLGSPDSSGNVKGVDVRFLDPFRDTANYLTLGGWISALNPAISAPLAAIDPNLIYGNTSLYPNVTYNSLYGIETSAPTGNPLAAAAEQFVPQIGAVDAAMQLASNYRGLATKNPNQFAKTIFESLNVPFAQVQNLNLKQLAAKGEIARYNVAKTAANNAWTSGGMGGSGIEKALAGYTSVPSPLNPAYEMTPAQLQELYNAALAAYPGQNPADVIATPPTPPPTYTP
jgi:hypothetical protein